MTTSYWTRYLEFCTGNIINSIDCIASLTGFWINHSFSTFIYVIRANSNFIIELCKVIGVTHGNWNDISLNNRLDFCTIKLCKMNHHDFFWTCGIVWVRTCSMFIDFDGNLVICFINAASLEISYDIQFL